MSETLRAAAFLDKGGTGKTTTVAHLGVALEELGHEVLLIDLAGKQGDLAKHFGVWGDYQARIEADEAWPNISTVFDDAWGTIAEKLGDDTLADLVVSTDEGPDLIPAHPGLDTLDAELGNIDDARERYSRLEQFLDEYVDPLGYDVVLVDLPGMTNNVAYNRAGRCATSRPREDCRQFRRRHRARARTSEQGRYPNESRRRVFGRV